MRVGDPVETETQETQEPVGHVKISYLGPVSPHWDVKGILGDESMISDFAVRVQARLKLLPPHDPQFRRNRERVAKDAERELIAIEWDLGYIEDES